MRKPFGKITTIFSCSLVVLLVTTCAISINQPTLAEEPHHFRLDQVGHLQCPKCGSQPGWMAHHARGAFECSSVAEGSGDQREHFALICSQCGFRGWTSIEEGRQARQTQLGGR